MIVTGIQLRTHAPNRIVELRGRGGRPFKVVMQKPSVRDFRLPTFGIDRHIEIKPPFGLPASPIREEQGGGWLNRRRKAASPVYARIPPNQPERFTLPHLPSLLRNNTMRDATLIYNIEGRRHATKSRFQKPGAFPLKHREGTEGFATLHGHSLRATSGP